MLPSYRAGQRLLSTLTKPTASRGLFSSTKPLEATTNKVDAVLANEVHMSCIVVGHDGFTFVPFSSAKDGAGRIHHDAALSYSATDSEMIADDIFPASGKQ